MNCRHVRRVVLQAEKPEPPPLDVRPHLNECADCRAWLRRAGDLERAIASVPVPASAARDRLVRLVRESTPASSPPPAQRKERGHRKLAFAFALAATVAGFAVGLWMWPQRETAQIALPQQADPAAVFQARLDSARTAGERVRVLADFADFIHGEVQAHTDDAPRLAELADAYVLRVQDLLVSADDVTAVERPALFQDVRARLMRTNSEMERLAVHLQPSAAPLRQIALAARAADRRLGALLRQKG